MSKKKKRNVLYFLIDSLRYDVFKNRDEARELVPNLSKLIDKGFVHKITSNGMITTLALPSIFTQTYPFDYGGINYGIKQRPKSFVELIKQEGYVTHYITTHYTTGPRRDYERGFDFTRGIYDNESIIEMYLRHIFSYEIELCERGEISEEELLSSLQKNFGVILKYAEWSGVGIKKTFMPRRLQIPSRKMSQQYRAERELLTFNPEAVLEKIKNIPTSQYYLSLGIEKLKYRLIIWRYFELLQSISNRLFKMVTRSGLTLFHDYVSPIAREAIDEALKFMKPSREPWFIMLHVMDVHQGANIRRLGNFIYKLHYFPKLFRIRKRYGGERNIWYDISLMYVDSQAKRLINKLEELDLFDDTVIMVSGDHGRGWDPGRDIKYQSELGLRTYYEQINAALIFSNGSCDPSFEGLHDGMSISATLLDELGIAPDCTFKGISVYKQGRKAVITEGYERRNCDLTRRDLAFTVTGKDLKLMVKLKKDQLKTVRLYDLKTDPNEFINMIDSDDYQKEINLLMEELVSQRKDLLQKRNVDVSKYKKTI